MSAPGKLVRSSRWKTGPSKGQRPLGSECCVVTGDMWSTPSRWQRRTGEGWCWAVGRSPAPPFARRWRRTGSRISGGENHEAPAAAAYGNRVQHSSQGGSFRRRARTHRRHERSVPRLRDHARLSRARARPPPNARRSANARPRSSGGRKKPSPISTECCTRATTTAAASAIHRQGPVGDAAKGRRADGPAPFRIISAHSFAAASPATICGEQSCTDWPPRECYHPAWRKLKMTNARGRKRALGDLILHSFWRPLPRVGHCPRTKRETSSLRKAIPQGQSHCGVQAGERGRRRAPECGRILW